MELYQFDRNSGKPITAYQSDFIMSRIVTTTKDAHIGCMYLQANGVVGYHQAAMPQLMLIMVGEGYVKGENNQFIRVEAGEAVFWKKGEWHETKTANGLTALVIESNELTPSVYMPLKK